MLSDPNKSASEQTEIALMKQFINYINNKHEHEKFDLSILEDEINIVYLCVVFFKKDNLHSHTIQEFKALMNAIFISNQEKKELFTSYCKEIYLNSIPMNHSALHFDQYLQNHSKFRCFFCKIKISIVDSKIYEVDYLNNCFDFKKSWFNFFLFVMCMMYAKKGLNSKIFNNIDDFQKTELYAHFCKTVNYQGYIVRNDSLFCCISKQMKSVLKLVLTHKYDELTFGKLMSN